MIKELDIGGVYFSPLLGIAVIALILAFLLTRLLHATGFYRWVWHRHLFDTALFVLIFTVLTLTLARFA